MAALGSIGKKLPHLVHLARHLAIRALPSRREDDAVNTEGCKRAKAAHARLGEAEARCVGGGVGRLGVALLRVRRRAALQLPALG